jgi:hypothetical protein
MNDIEFPIYQSELVDLFGKPNKNAPWLKFIDLSQYKDQLSHVKGYWERTDDGRWGFTGHELLDIMLPPVIETLIDRDKIRELRTFDGCFNIRKMTSGVSWSVHSWGLAVDFNASSNPYGGDVSFSDAYLACWADNGWECGALWNTPDGMHCQIPWTQRWDERPSGVYTPKMNFPTTTIDKEGIIDQTS